VEKVLSKILGNNCLRGCLKSQKIDLSLALFYKEREQNPHFSKPLPALGRGHQSIGYFSDIL
jgi:hypothetical protein